MSMTFGPTLSNYLDLRYRIILDLEEGEKKRGHDQCANHLAGRHSEAR